MMLLLLAFLPSALLLFSNSGAVNGDIQRTKHFSTVSADQSDSLRLRDILSDERYESLFKDLRSPVRRRQRRSPLSGSGGGTSSSSDTDDANNFDIELTTEFAEVMARKKNTKRTKNVKKTTKHSNLPTSTPSFTPSKSSSASGNRVKVSAAPPLVCYFVEYYLLIITFLYIHQLLCFHNL